MVWLGLGPKTTWLGLGKYHVLAFGIGYHKHNMRCLGVEYNNKNILWSQTPLDIILRSYQKYLVLLTLTQTPSGDGLLVRLLANVVMLMF